MGVSYWYDYDTCWTTSSFSSWIPRRLTLGAFRNQVACRRQSDNWLLYFRPTDPDPRLIALLDYARCARELKKEGEKKEKKEYIKKRSKQSKRETWKSAIPPFQDITITLQSF